MVVAAVLLISDDDPPERDEPLSRKPRLCASGRL